jgi:hypothetical protein
MPEVKHVPSSQPEKPIVFASVTNSTPSYIVSIEAPHYSRAVDGAGLQWRDIPNLGRTLGSITAFPQGRD